jgi:hypothetical protein
MFENGSKLVGFKSISQWLLLALSMSAFAHAAPLDDSFKAPDDSDKPWCYWYWLNGEISKDGITKDLEAMNRVGIKQAMIGNIFGGAQMKMFSDEWYDAVNHAFREADRLSIDLMHFNGPGWSQSGGPWIKPEQSMRRVSWNEYEAHGGKFSQIVRPKDMPASQVIAVLAVPKLDAVAIDGVPQGKMLEFVKPEPFVARSLEVYGKAKGKLFAVRDGKRELVADINAAGGSDKTDFLIDGVEAFGIKDVSAARFEFEPAAKCKLVLSSRPIVTQFIEKQMGRMHPTPSPTWESYLFPDSVQPEDPKSVIQRKQVIDLTKNVNADGVLDCTLPDGEWTVIHFGMVSTGKENHPAPKEATGLECDKMSKTHIRYHFDSMFGPMLAKMGPAEKKAFKGITIDSYEVGAQNWTDGFAAEFEKRNGYNPILLLPVMTGRMIDNANQSDQFLWDLRRTVAEMIAENYVGGLREVAHEHGLSLWCENYGHWGFPGEFLSYGGQSDMVGGEFWTGQALGNIECRAASSACHTYGKRTVYAEAFTSSLKLGDNPHTIKRRGEELFCEGINHYVLHVYAHQTTDGAPGKNPWFGTAFNRNNPWFMESRDWVRYLQRCSCMLRQGNPVADVAVFIGDFAPQMTGPANPVPAGYDYDFIGADVILNRLEVVDGKWVVRDEKDPKRIAASYSLLALPSFKFTRPQVTAKIEALKKQGGKTIDSVSLKQKDMDAAGIAPLVAGESFPLRWKVRSLDDGGMIFFLSNFKQVGPFEATLRVKGMIPEQFNPVTGKTTKLACYKSVDNGTRVSIDVKDIADSCFIVFREKSSAPSVASVTKDGKPAAPTELLLSFDSKNQLTAECASAGTYTLQMSDGTKREVKFEQESPKIDIKGTWQKTDDGKKVCSGVFASPVDVPAKFADGGRVILDLGPVAIMAKVKLNETTFDTLWMPPYTIDVTDALKTGTNQISVEITSVVGQEAKLSEAVTLRSTRRIIVKP